MSPADTVRRFAGFGVFDHVDRGDEPIGQLYENRLRLAELADAAGFRTWHVAEHHATPLGMAPSPGILLAALAQRTRRLRFGGFLAWLFWLGVHIYFLVGFRNRLFVVLQWAWSYVSYGRGARLIVSRDWRHEGLAELSG